MGNCNYILLIVWQVCCLLPCAAQDGRFTVQSITEADGLAQDFIYSVLQDDRGYVWVGTGKGLSRFDGVKMENYSTQRGLAGNFVTASYQAADGLLYFGHFQGGISLYNGFAFKAIQQDSLGSRIIAFAEDDAHTIWVASQANGLGFLNNKKKISWLVNENLKDVIINDMRWHQQKLWVATNEGLITFTIANQQCN